MLISNPMRNEKDDNGISQKNFLYIKNTSKGIDFYINLSTLEVSFYLTR